jgi:signal transduction histidine kinase
MDTETTLFNSINLLAQLERGADNSPYAGMLRLMCDNVPDLLWAKDLNKRYLFVNQAICDKLLCARDTMEPIGKDDMYFTSRERSMHPDDSEWHTFGEICRDSDSIVMESGEAGRFDEFGNVQGDFLFLDVYKAPFRDETGQLIGTVGCGRVVTDERRMAEALRERTAAGDEGNRVLLGSVTHELRTPLSGMIGVVDSILDKPLGEDVRSDVDLLRDTARTLLSLVDDLVGLSEMNTRPELLHRRPFRLRKDLIGPVRRLMAPLAKARGLGFEARVDGTLPELLYGDSLRIRQILYNLIGNAVKYTDHGRVSLSVEQASPLFPDEVKVHLLFSVSDTGQGIPEDIRSSLFNVFSRSDESTQRRQTGNGLGLAVVKNLAAAMDGRIEVESDPSYGAVFRVYIELPVAEEGQGTDTSGAVPSALEAEQFLRQRKPLILIVDDNDLHRLSIGWALRKAGCRVKEARNGLGALSCLGDDYPDAVFIDNRMPDIQGPDLMPLIRKECPEDTVFLAVTAWVGAAERDNLLRSGFSAVLIKPAAPALLYNVLSSLLRG